MSPFRFRNEPPYIYQEEEEESSSRNAIFIAIGAAAGFAAGVLMAERFGGFKGLTDRIKDTFGGGTAGEEEEFDYEGLDEDEFDPDFDDDIDTPKASLNGAEALEERVLEAFKNDPTLSERAIDIGAVEDGIIELTGTVNSEEEAHQAVVVARGTPTRRRSTRPLLRAKGNVQRAQGKIFLEGKEWPAGTWFLDGVAARAAEPAALDADVILYLLSKNPPAGASPRSPCPARRTLQALGGLDG